MARAGDVRSEAGATAVLVAITLVLLIGFAALALDLARVYGVRNELKNAADAAALAAAASLYTRDSSGSVDAGANAVARDAVNAMRTAGLTIDDPGPRADLVANTGDIQRGHWSHGANRFYRCDATALPADFFSRSAAELDDPSTHDFVNAVLVRTRRQTNPITMTFARIFGIGDLVTQRASIAWLGYSGSFTPWEIDAPIAVCRDSIVDADGKLTCSYGRMIPGNDDTAMWSNFTQDPTPYAGESTCGDPTTAATNYPGLRNLINPGGVCAYGGVNPEQIKLGYGVSTQNGEVQTAHADLRACWQGATVDHDNDPDTPAVPIDPDGDGKPDYPWKITLLVIDCQNSGCNKVVGAVSLEVLWITVNGSDPNYDQIPERMWDERAEPPAFWSCSSSATNPVERKAERIACVNSFFARFNLHDGAGNLAAEDPPNHNQDWLSTALFFRPDCEAKEPAGSSGGQNYGILARTPVLVDHLRIDAHAETVLENQ
jgi:Flp pilus assembly protein TadG